MSEKKFATSQEAKKAGWFSKRNETSEAHQKSTEEFRARKNQRRIEAQERQAEHDKLSLAEKLEKARKINPNSRETKRLQKQLDAQKTTK